MSPIKREVLIGDCRLLFGDCTEIMPTLGEFDAVVTDPPYGINQAGGFTGAGGFSKPIQRRTYQGDWDSKRPEKSVFEIILKSGKFNIVWGGNFFSDYLPVSGKWLFWDKCQTMPTFSDGELAWTNLTGCSVKQFIYNGSGAMAKEKNRVHPTQKPVELMAWCLGFLPDAKTILDPFMGSGTTGVACAKTGRKFTGIEIDPDYFEIACERIRKAYEQPDMFVQPLIQLEQIVMELA